MSLNDLRLLVYERLKLAIPEAVLGKVAESVSDSKNIYTCMFTFLLLNPDFESTCLSQNKVKSITSRLV